MFCDSEEPHINDQKPELREKGVVIIDCENNYALEDQVFKDVPWGAVKELIPIAVQKVMEIDEKTQEEAERSIFDCINANMAVKMTSPEGWYDNENDSLRKALGKTAQTKKKDWFKRQDYGEMMGNVIMAHYDELPSDCRLKQEIDAIITWMDA